MEQDRHPGKRFLLTTASVLMLAALTGCWSSKDIDKKGVGVGLALDAAIPSRSEKQLEKNGGGFPKKNRVTLTYQFVNPKSMGKESSSSGTQQKAYINVSQSGDSLQQITREFSLFQDAPIFSPHLKVIVISEELARTFRLDHLLDQYFRDNAVRPSCLVFISTGLARDSLETKKQGELPALHLLGITDNRNRTDRILPPMSLAKLSGKLNSGSSFLLQNVVTSEKRTKFAGAALINGKTKKWTGFLNEKDLEGITWITGKGKDGLVKSYDKKTGQLFIYEIESMDSKIIPIVDGNKISFQVNIHSKGRLSENWVTGGNPSDESFLKRVKAAAESEVMQLVKNTTAMLQTKLHADVAGFGDRLRIENPGAWENVKKDWDSIFSTVPISYSVKLTITDYGAAKQIK